MYSATHKVKGGAVARMILCPLQELVAEPERYAERVGKSIPDFIREELELRYLHRLPERKREDISDRPEVRRAIQIQDDMRRRMEGSDLRGSEFVCRMHDGE